MTKKTINKDLAAVILSGGLSTRMGRDKALLHPYGQAEPNMLARTHAILANHFDKIWISCAKNKEREGYSCLIDEFAEIGPISGIYAGLQAAKAENFKAVLVLPCDLPLVDDDIIKKLVTAREESKKKPATTYLMTTFYHIKTGHIEALVSIYEVESLELFKKGIAENIRAPRLVIPAERQCRIVCSEDTTQNLFNLNTKQEYADFQEKINS